MDGEIDNVPGNSVTAIQPVFYFDRFIGKVFCLKEVTLKVAVFHRRQDIWKPQPEN